MSCVFRVTNFAKPEVQQSGAKVKAASLQSQDEGCLSHLININEAPSVHQGNNMVLWGPMHSLREGMLAVASFVLQGQGHLICVGDGHPLGSLQNCVDD